MMTWNLPHLSGQGMLARARRRTVGWGVRRGGQLILYHT